MRKKFQNIPVKSNTPKAQPKKDCRTCDNRREVQVAPPKYNRVRTKQQYQEPRWIACPDC